MWFHGLDQPLHQHRLLLLTWHSSCLPPYCQGYVLKGQKSALLWEWAALRKWPKKPTSSDSQTTMMFSLGQGLNTFSRERRRLVAGAVAVGRGFSARISSCGWECEMGRELGAGCWFEGLRAKGPVTWSFHPVLSYRCDCHLWFEMGMRSGDSWAAFLAIPLPHNMTPSK